MHGPFDMGGNGSAWTERAGPDVALRIVSGIIETILLLSQQQRMGRAVEEFGAGVMEVSVWPLRDLLPGLARPRSSAARIPRFT